MAREEQNLKADAQGKKRIHRTKLHTTPMTSLTSMRESWDTLRDRHARERHTETSFNDWLAMQRCASFLPMTAQADAWAGSDRRPTAIPRVDGRLDHPGHHGHGRRRDSVAGRARPRRRSGRLRAFLRRVWSVL